MKIQNKFKKIDWNPRSKQVNKETLKLLLHNIRQHPLFCHHNWVYWTFGPATKKHRICKKCYKKQQDKQVISKYRSTWIQDCHFA